MARQVFDAEPKEVTAISVNSGVTSFNADDVGSYRVLGTKGQVHVEPGYEYAEGLKYAVTVNGETTRSRKTPKPLAPAHHEARRERVRSCESVLELPGRSRR